jgi:hypothetical protein
MPTTEPSLNPVPFKVNVKVPLPAVAELGVTLVKVSGEATILKLAKTSVSSVAVRLAGLVDPVRS